MYNVRIDTEYTFEGSPAVAGQHTFQAAGEYKRDYEISQQTNGKRFPLSIQLPITLAIIFLASCRMRLNIGKQSFELDSRQPLIWVKSLGQPCPLQADADFMTVDFLEDGPCKGGVLKIRIPEGDEPIVPAVAVAVPAGPELSLSAAG
jgi:hypothetical protein